MGIFQNEFNLGEEMNRDLFNRGRLAIARVEICFMSRRPHLELTFSDYH